MIPSRRALFSLSRQTFSSTSLKFRPSGLLATATKPTQRNVQPYLNHQIRQKSTDAPSIPSTIRSGDWVCVQCQAHNFVSRSLCFECQSPMKEGRIFYEEGSWHCPKCDISVWKRSDHCPRCITPKSEGTLYPLSERDIKIPGRPAKGVYTRKGDWTCIDCGEPNKARSTKCKGCDRDRKITPAEEIMGDWQCNDCRTINFANRKTCIICNVKRPNQHETLNPSEAWGQPGDIN